MDDIIIKLSHERQERSGRELGKEKNPKKHLTNGAISDIILKLLKRAARIEKSFWKTWKKYLTKTRRCDIILKLSDKDKRKQHLENWTMQEKSNDPWDSFYEEKTQVKSKKCAVITQALLNRIDILERELWYILFNKEFDPGSGRTLAARLTHASRTENFWFTGSS